MSTRTKHCLVFKRLMAVNHCLVPVPILFRDFLLCLCNIITSHLLYPTYYFFQLSTTKGFVAGNLSYTEEDGTKVNCTCSATVCIANHKQQSIAPACTRYPALLVAQVTVYNYHKPLLVAN